MDMRYNFLNRRKGTTPNGDYHVVSLIVTEPGDTGKSFTCDFFVNIEMFVKCENFKQFQAVDAIFAPSPTGKAKLVEIIGL